MTGDVDALAWRQHAIDLASRDPGLVLLLPLVLKHFRDLLRIQRDMLTIAGDPEGAIASIDAMDATLADLEERAHA